MFRPRLHRPLAALRARLAREQGVVLVLVSICLLALLGAAALAVDLGSFYGAQKQAQSAADAAALAAAHDVGYPINTTQASADVQAYVSRNDPGATPLISYPSTHQIRVTVNQTVPTFFAQIWGQSSQRVSASATAGANIVAPQAAVFAADTTCGNPGVTFTGNSSVVVNGSVHSNGTLSLGGSSATTITGSASYGGPNNCSDPMNGQQSIGSGPTDNPRQLTWPKDYSSVANLCTSPPPGVPVFNNTNFSWSGNGTTQITQGIYCATSTISFSGSGTFTGNATFIAPSISIGGNVTFDVTPDNADLPAGLNDLIVYMQGPGTLQFQGSALQSDSVFAPQATVEVMGNAQTSVSGYIEANDIEFAGTAALTITGTGPSIPGDAGAALVQ